MADRLIGFDAQMLFESSITALSILLLFFALSYLLFDPIKEVLRKRQEKIATELADANEKSKDANLLKAEYEAKLRDIEKESDRILEEARKKAKLREEEIISEAKAEAFRISERAAKEIELEKRKALDDVKQEIINIANLMAGKAISNAMDINIHQALLDETLKEISENTWQS